MIGYPEAPRAYWMAQGMARAAGVPLARAVVDGLLRRDELARIVTRCQTCERAADCTAWLSVARCAPPPAFCGNKADLDALRLMG